MADIRLLTPDMGFKVTTCFLASLFTCFCTRTITHNCVGILRIGLQLEILAQYCGLTMQHIIGQQIIDKYLKVSEWEWKILSVAKSSRHILVDPDSRTKTLKVTEWKWKILVRDGRLLRSLDATGHPFFKHATVHPI